jgi:hypothetical protein
MFPRVAFTLDITHGGKLPPIRNGLVGGICGSLIRSNGGGSPVRSAREPVRASALLLFVASCLLNQLLLPVNTPSDRADPGKCQQRALCGS